MERRIGLQEKLLAAVAEYDMLEAGQRILVAVSGGPDSMALLHVLYTLSGDLPIQLAVAHLNHQLRGVEADKDEQYVQSCCQQWDLPCFVERRDIAALAADQKLSVEAAGRQARYEFFARLADQHGFDRVALGHTATDRVETLLINLLRGTGLYGLRSIPPRRGQFFRPLFTVWRAETAEYCRLHNLEPRLDASNLSACDYLRYKVRLERLPLLESDYAPQLETSLLRLAGAVEQELDWTEPLVAAAYQQAARGDDRRITLDLTQLADMPEGLRYRLLRYALIQLRGEAADIEATYYRALQKLIREGQTGAQVPLIGAISARRGYNSIELSTYTPEEAPEPAIRGRWILPVPGKVTAPELDLTLQAQVMAQRPDELGEAKGCQITVDAQAIGDELFVRTWRPGDSFQPLGLSGHKKLQDIFVDEKVPRRQRGRVPLLVTGDDEIVWVVGYRLSEQFKVSAQTQRFLKLTVVGEQPTTESDN